MPSLRLETSLVTLSKMSWPMTKTKLWTSFGPDPLLLDPFYIIEVGDTGRRHTREDIASDELGIHRQVGRGEMPWDLAVVVINYVAYIPVFINFPFN